MKQRLLASSSLLRASVPLESILPQLLYRQVSDLGLRTVLDLTTVSEEQLHGMRGVGRLTIHRLREILSSLGLQFQESADPVLRARKANELARRLPMSERVRGIDDAAHIAQLGMDWMTVRQCMSRNVTTVGQLRSLERKQIVATFTRRVAVELLACQRDLSIAPRARAAPASARRRPMNPMPRTPSTGALKSMAG